MTDFLATETVIIELMLVFSLVAMAVRRLRVPYTVALVIVGLLMTIGQPFHVSLTPDLILGLLVPPLVFEAAFQLNLRDLQRSLPMILILAVPGVILTMLIVGGIVTLVTGLPLMTALLFGALISATDPVSVVSLFRRLGVPRRLSVLVEGESLLNDGTAIVLFDLVLGIVLGGHANLLQSGLDFLRIAVGGVLVGLILGWIVSRLIARVDDYLIEITFTTILAFGSYLVAERLQVSGVLAVVAAGLINGNLGPRGMSPSTRIVLLTSGRCRLSGQLTGLPSHRYSGRYSCPCRSVAADPLGSGGRPGGARGRRLWTAGFGAPVHGANTPQMVARSRLGSDCVAPSAWRWRSASRQRSVRIRRC